MNLGAFGTLQIQPTRVIKKLKEPKDHFVFENEIRILKRLKDKRISQQGWIPRDMEWRPSTFEISMQRLFYDKDNASSTLFPEVPSEGQKREFKKMVQNAFRDLKRMHRILFHMDLHVDNMMIRKSQRGKGKHKVEQYQVVFIDFGMSLLVEDIKRYFSSTVLSLLKLYETRNVYTFLTHTFSKEWQKRCIREVMPVIPSLTEKQLHMYDDIHDFCILLVQQGRFSS